MSLFHPYQPPGKLANALTLSAARHQTSAAVDDAAPRSAVRHQCALRSAQGLERAPVCAAFMAMQPRPQHTLIDAIPSSLAPLPDPFIPSAESACGTSCAKATEL